MMSKNMYINPFTGITFDCQCCVLDKEDFIWVKCGKNVSFYDPIKGMTSTRAKPEIELICQRGFSTLSKSKTLTNYIAIAKPPFQD